MESNSDTSQQWCAKPNTLMIVHTQKFKKRLVPRRAWCHPNPGLTKQRRHVPCACVIAPKPASCGLFTVCLLSVCLAALALAPADNTAWQHGMTINASVPWDVWHSQYWPALCWIHAEPSCEYRTESRMNMTPTGFDLLSLLQPTAGAGLGQGSGENSATGQSNSPKHLP